MSDEGDPGAGEPGTAEAVLDRTGFAAGDSVLTRRQAEVLALRERGLAQAAIADRLGTSRANVSSVEASARENVRKARETVAFADALQAPVRLIVAAGTDLYDVPDMVYTACDEADLKVDRSAPELMKAISEDAGDCIRGREVREDLLVGVTRDSTIQVRRKT